MNEDGNLLLALLESMNGTKWVIIGVLLLILEVLSGTTYILWPAVAAIAVGILVFILPLAWEMQFVLFFILSTVLLIFGHTHIRPRLNKDDAAEDLNDRAKSMVGMRVRAIADFDTGRGRVQVGDTQWRATMPSGDAKAGDELKVVSVKGTTLTVEAFAG